MKILVSGYAKGEFIPDGKEEKVEYYSLYVLQPIEKDGSDGYYCQRAKMNKEAYESIKRIFNGDITSCECDVDLTGRVTTISEN